MRLRVAVDWAGDTVEDRVHDARELRVGAAAEDDVTVPGDPAAAVRFVEIGALVIVELPASLVAEVEWPDGARELCCTDRELALAGERTRGRIVLRGSPLDGHATVLRFSLEPPAVHRRDVALAAWGAAALLLAIWTGATIAFASASGEARLVGPRALAIGDAALLRVSLVVDPSASLSPVDAVAGDGRGGRRAGATAARDGADAAGRYARLLVEGFDRYVAADLGGAEDRWTDAAELEPERPEAWVNLAQVQKRRGAVARERRLLARALSAAPAHCEALVNMALVEARLHDLAAGREVLDRARRACGARTAFLLLDEAALFASGGERAPALDRIEAALAALDADTDDKRREALADLERDPVFATVRAEPRFRAVLSRLRRALSPA